MAKDKDKYIFYFSKLHKGWKNGQAPSAITYFPFGEDKAQCVVETLNYYISRSKPWRTPNPEKQLLLISIKLIMQLYLVPYQLGLKKLLNRLELILIY